METHVAMASGGAYAAVHAGFWEAAEGTASGRRFRNSVTGISGSSAGALVGMLIAEGVPAHLIAEDVRRGGIRGRFPKLRALAVYASLPGFKRAAFSEVQYLLRMKKLCNARVHNRVPMTVAVTDAQLVQRCVPLEPDKLSLDTRVKAAVTSASIPFVLPAQTIGRWGMCVDGSVNRCSFAEEALHTQLLTASGKLVVLNCLAWPGYRGTAPPMAADLLSISTLAGSYGEQLYAHGLEGLFRDSISPPVQFKDGMFEVFIDNTGGSCRQVGASDTYNLHVVFVAPTEKQFLACGGLRSIADLHYGKGYQKVADMVEVGKLMGHQYVQWHGDVSFM